MIKIARTIIIIGFVILVCIPLLSAIEVNNEVIEIKRSIWSWIVPSVIMAILMAIGWVVNRFVCAVDNLTETAVELKKDLALSKKEQEFTQKKVCNNKTLINSIIKWIYGHINIHDSDTNSKNSNKIRYNENNKK